MRRLFEPHETLEGRLDPGEILFGQGRRNMPIIASQQKENWHIKGQVPLAQIEPGNFVLKLYQGKAVTLPKPDEVDQVCLIGAQGGPDEFSC